MVSSITFTESWNGEWLGRPFQQKKCSKLGWFIVRLTLLSIISLISQERCQTMRHNERWSHGFGWHCRNLIESKVILQLSSDYRASSASPVKYGEPGPFDETQATAVSEPTFVQDQLPRAHIWQKWNRHVHTVTNPKNPLRGFRHFPKPVPWPSVRRAAVFQDTVSQARRMAITALILSWFDGHNLRYPPLSDKPVC